MSEDKPVKAKLGRLPNGYLTVTFNGRKFLLSSSGYLAKGDPVLVRRYTPESLEVLDMAGKRIGMARSFTSLGMKGAFTR